MRLGRDLGAPRELEQADAVGERDRRDAHEHACVEALARDLGRGCDVWMVEALVRRDSASNAVVARA
jgi:hypothetical protein